MSTANISPDMVANNITPAIPTHLSNTQGRN